MATNRKKYDDEKIINLKVKAILRNSMLPDNGNLFMVGSTKFLSYDTLNYISIGRLAISNVCGNAKGFKLFYRDEEHLIPYNVKVEDYEFSSNDALSVLGSFPESGNFSFIKKGKELLPSRLCPFYSKKRDASGRWITWTGTQWQ